MLAGLVAAVIVAWLIAGSALVDRLTPLGLEALETVLGMPVSVADLDIELAPMRLCAESVTIGAPAFARAADLDLEVDVIASLVRRRIVASLHVLDLGVDTTLFDGADRSDSGSVGGSAVAAIPPLDLALAIDGCSVVGAGSRSVVADKVRAGLGVDGRRSGRMTLEIAELGLRRSDDSIGIDRLSLTSRYRDGLISVDRLTVESRALSVEAAASGGGATTATGLEVAPTKIHLLGDVGAIANFVSPGLNLAGRLEVSGQLAGSVFDPEIVAQIDLEDAAWRTVKVDSVTGAAVRRRGTWQTRELRASVAAGVLVADLHYAESTKHAVATLQWNRVDLDRLEDDIPPRWQLFASGDLELSADLGSFEGRASGAARIFSRDVALVPLAVDARLSDAGLSGLLRAGPVDDGELSLRVANASWNDLDATLTVELAEISTLLEMFPVAGVPLVEGGLSLSAEISGTPRAPVAEVTASSAGLQVAGVDWGRLAAAATVTRQSIAASNVSLRGDRGILVGSGEVGLTAGSRNDWTLQFRAIDSAGIAPLLAATTGVEAALSGRIDADLAGRGGWRDLVASVVATSDRLDVGAAGLIRPRATLDWSAGTWRATFAGTGAEGGDARVEVAGNGTAVLRVDGAVRDWAMSKGSTAVFGPVAGQVDLMAKLEAGERGTSGEFEVAVSGLDLGGAALGESVLRGTGEDGVWKVDGALFDRRASLVGRVDERAGKRFKLSVDWSDVQLIGLERNRHEVSSTVSGNLRLAGNFDSPGDSEGRVELTKVAIEGGFETIENEGPIVVVLRPGKLALEPFVLAGSQTRIHARASARADGDFDLAMSGVADLGWLELATTAIDTAKGTVDIDLKVAGDGQSMPNMEGKLELEGAALEVAGLTYVTDITGAVEIDSGVLRTRGLSGRVGAGKVALDGEVDPADGIDLHWHMRNVALSPTDHMEGVVSAEGTLTGPWQDVLLAGSVEVDEFLYDRDLEFQDLIPSFDRALDPAPESRDRRPPLRLDLRLHARDGLHVDNNIARLEARTDLRLTGTARNPTLQGTIEIIDGRIELRGRHFDVVNGVLTFKPDLRSGAYIDFVAESFIETPDLAYVVEVRVSGTTERYRVQLASEDGLSQTDIASLIAFGRTVAQLQESSTGSNDGGVVGVPMDIVANLAGGQIGKYLAAGVQEQLPFDEVQLRPGFSPSTGAFEPQIRVGKTITHNLSAWLAQTFGVQSQTSVEMSYDLSSRISAVLRWESKTTSQEGGLGGDISQSMDFWGLPEWLSWGPSHFGGTVD